MSRYLTKGAPLRKEAPIKRGGKLQFNLGFTPASQDEILKAVGAETPDGYIAGWASTTSRDLYNHEIVAGAFQKSIDDRGLNGPKAVKFLLDHDHTKPAGVIKVLEYRRGNLWLEAQMNLEVGYIKDRWHMLKMMGGANFSVGFMLQDYEIVIRNEDKEDEDYFLRIDRGDLFEVSSVMLPGNEECHNVFVKSLFHEDDEDELLFAQAKSPLWQVGASKNLPAVDVETWDYSAVKNRLFKAANFDSDKPDYDRIRKGFLVYDSANPELRGSYKLAIADIIDGRMQVCSVGVNAARMRIAQLNVSDKVKSAAQDVIEQYEQQCQDVIAAKSVPTSITEFEKMLVARGLVQTRRDAQAIVQVAKACPHVFQKKIEIIDTPLDAGKLTEALSLVQKMKSILAPVASDASLTVKL